MPRVGPACAVSKLSGTFDENELELAASPGPRRAGSSIDPTSADKIKKLEAALEQGSLFFYILSFAIWGRCAAHGERGARSPTPAGSAPVGAQSSRRKQPGEARDLSFGDLW
jgi:hypothetical protein